MLKEGDFGCRLNNYKALSSFFLFLSRHFDTITRGGRDKLLGIFLGKLLIFFYEDPGWKLMCYQY